MLYSPPNGTPIGYNIPILQRLCSGAWRDLDAESDLVLLLGDEEAVALLDGDTVPVILSVPAHSNPVSRLRKKSSSALRGESVPMSPSPSSDRRILLFPNPG